MRPGEGELALCCKKPVLYVDDIVYIYIYRERERERTREIVRTNQINEYIDGICLNKYIYIYC